MSIMIREALPTDSAFIHRLCEHDLRYKCDPEKVKNRIIGSDRDRERILVAEFDGEIVGFIHVEEYSLLYADKMANILGIAVSHRYRRQGAGKELLNAAEEWAIANKMTLMRVTSGKNHENAHEFYRNSGFSHEKDQVRFIKTLRSNQTADLNF